MDGLEDCLRGAVHGCLSAAFPVRQQLETLLSRYLACSSKWWPHHVPVGFNWDWRECYMLLSSFIAHFCVYQLLHGISNWKTGTLIPAKFTGAIAQAEFQSMLDGLNQMEEEFPGWFKMLSQHVYRAAS